MYKRDSYDGAFTETIPAYPAKDDCLSRIPYASVMAFVMCLIGVIMFVIMMVWSFNASVEQARRALDITDIPWLDRVHLMFIIVAVIMIIIALFLLLIGVLSTGSTREEVYKRKASRRGGRIFCAIAIMFSYLLNIVWMFVIALTAILAFVYYIFSQLCSSLQGYSEGQCLDFSLFQPLFSDVAHSSLNLCGGNVQEFCAVTNTVFSWYIVGFVGAMIICLGLVQFLASNAANYAHVNNEQRYIELNQVLFAEGIDKEHVPPLPPTQPPMRSFPHVPHGPAVPRNDYRPRRHHSVEKQRHDSWRRYER